MERFTKCFIFALEKFNYEFYLDFNENENNFEEVIIDLEDYSENLFNYIREGYNLKEDFAKTNESKLYSKFLNNNLSDIDITMIKEKYEINLY